MPTEVDQKPQQPVAGIPVSINASAKAVTAISAGLSTDSARQGHLRRFFGSPFVAGLAYLSADLLAVVLAHAFAISLVKRLLHVSGEALNPPDYRWFYVPLFAFSLYLFDGYKSPELRRSEQELERTCKAAVVSFLVLVLFNFIAFRSKPFSRYLLAAWFVASLILLLFSRFSLRSIYKTLWRAGICRRKALLLGSAEGMNSYQQLLSIQRHRGYDLTGILLGASTSEVFPGLVKTCYPAGWLKRVKDELETARPSVLIIASEGIPQDGDWPQQVLDLCRFYRTDVEVYSSVLATSGLNYEHDEFSGCFRFFARPGWATAIQRVLKRMIDLAFGVIGSCLTVLLTPLIWLLVYAEDPGPVFHLREFVGTDGKVHYYRKFRTMVKDADTILRNDAELRAKYLDRHKLENDPRLLRIGKFLRHYSIDEFPQFFSLISGRLTLVGPRVISSEERGRYGSKLQKLLSFKPGLTGFWQVTGRQTTTYEERVRMDMFYIERWSIWLDVVIILKTFWKLLRAEGAY